MIDKWLSDIPAARVPRWVRWSAVAVFMAVYVYGASWSASIQDTVRDLYQAWDIRHGIALPLEGPILGIPHAIHFGPIWFYLLALPLFISDTWTAAIVFAGLLCSLKFPLAYYCGRRLLNGDFGMLWAAALAIPNWSLLEQLVVFNPNAAPMAILLALAIFLRARDGGAPIACGAALGLSLGFALHVHPTAAPVIALAPLLLFHMHRRGDSTLAPLIAMLAGFALLFMPYFASQVIHRFPDFVSANAYMQRQVSASNVEAWPALLSSLFFEGPRAMSAAIIGMREEGAVAVGAIVSALSAGALTTLKAKVAAVRQAGMSVRAALFLFSITIVVLRPNTPFYFFYALGPCVAALVALALWQVGARFGSVPTAVFVVVASALHATASWELARMVRSGNGTLPTSVLDIKASSGTAVFTDVWYPTWHRRLLARVVCSERELTLHGHLAYIEDRAVGLDRLFGCGDLSSVRLGGTPGGTHLFAMSRKFWGALGTSPRCWVGSLGVAENVRPVFPTEGLEIVDGRVYFPRPVSQAIAKPLRVTFESGPGEAVLVTNILAGYDRLENVHVHARGMSLQPIAANEVSALYVWRDSTGTANWQVDFEASNPRAIDIVILKTTSGNGAASSCDN